MDDSVASPADPGPGSFTEPVTNPAWTHTVEPLVSVHRADNGDLVIVINRNASAADVMLSMLQAMGAH